MDAKMIIEALSSRPRLYPREAVQAAMDQRDEVVPLLLEHLERVIREPEALLSSAEPAPLLLDYAVYLLGHHRVREAHQPLIALASLPGKLPDDLLGDTIGEGLDVLLWKTSGGESGDITRLAENRSADVSCRTAAIKALVHGVAEKVLSRDDVVEFLRGLLGREEALEDDPELWNEAAGALIDLWPGESMDILRLGFDEGLILDGVVGRESVEEALDAGKEAQLAERQKQKQARAARKKARRRKKGKR